MSNTTFNFNAPIHIQMEYEVDGEALQEIMEKLCDLEDLMCELIDMLYGDTDLEDEDVGEDVPAEDGSEKTCAPQEEGVPLVLCFSEDLPDDFFPDETTALAYETLSRILNFKSSKEAHHGRA